MSDSQSVQATLLAEERRLRMIDDHEEAVLINSRTGQVLWRKVGEASRVGFDGFDIRWMPGNILTHNHPVEGQFREGDPRNDGDSFSPSDIGMLVESGLAELRVVTKRYTFSVRPPDPADNSLAAQAFVRHIAPQGYDPVVEILKTFSEQIRMAQQRQITDPKGSLTRSQAEAMHYHLVMIEVARSWGLRYTREEV